jgi:hypothetical protein
MSHTIATIMDTNAMTQVRMARPFTKPLLCSHLLTGKKSIDNSPPKQNGTKNGFAKNIAAVTRKKKRTIYRDLCIDGACCII